MDVLPDWPVDQDLVDVATASLQTHERFSALMRTRLQNNFAAKNGTYIHTVYAYIRTVHIHTYMHTHIFTSYIHTYNSNRGR